VESLRDIQVETGDYLSKMSGLSEEINGRFHDLRSLEPSFSFLENLFGVDVVGDSCLVSSPTAVVKLELLELQEDERLKGLKRSGVSTIEFSEKCPRRKTPTNKRVC